ncbi:alpha-2-macroglobulin-like protein 1 [Trachemys scripta elegans]|uniref:alpha-2-macroglobulin-like protein 1 n=1 Tax=Trachemys scripta elegans TaxID=31138 RepID=UPI001556220E|nr:alpha-2-macroglobulin-like protein 1 [Trachemys scripta elegans]
MKGFEHQHPSKLKARIVPAAPSHCSTLTFSIPPCSSLSVVPKSGLEFNATQSCRVTSSVTTLQFLDNNIYYQPGAPYHGRLKLNSANGMPLKNTEVFLTVYRGKMQSETYLSDHTGVTSFTLDTSPWRDSDKVSLQEKPGF